MSQGQTLLKARGCQRVLTGVYLDKALLDQLAEGIFNRATTQQCIVFQRINAGRALGQEVQYTRGSRRYAQRLTVFLE
ncbi:hypothetical protein D3C84_1122920 [compost metagenome]